MAAVEAIPRDASLVEVRGQRWVSDSSPGGEGSTLLTLQSVEDGRYGESLQVIWKVEPDRRALPAGFLPEALGARYTIGPLRTPGGPRLPSRLNLARYAAEEAAVLHAKRTRKRSVVSDGDTTLF